MPEQSSPIPTSATDDPVLLGGGPLTPGDLQAIAEEAKVAIAAEGLERMREGRAVLMRLAGQGVGIYGVTTGLGPFVKERLDTDMRDRFSLATIRGRAHGAGAPLPAGFVRAAMAIRTHTMLSGAIGVRPELASFLAECLNRQVTPVLAETASIGAADLLWGGSMGLSLIGEGEMETPAGRRPATEALVEAGLSPWQPALREGLALCSHSSVTAAIAALGLARADRLTETATVAAALSLEGFRANLSPLDSDLMALSPKPGEAAAAEALRGLLHGSDLHQPGAARRLQDPLSLRNIVQVFGALGATLGFLRESVIPEINGLSDNPVVLAERGAVLSGGSYLAPGLAISLQAGNQALTHWAAQTLARFGKMLSPRFTDLPSGLTDQGAGGAGFAAALKLPEALFAEIAHLAQPAPVYPSLSADGLEDTITHAAIPAKAMHKILDRAEHMLALELMIAVQAIELRDAEIAPPLRPFMAKLRDVSAPLREDRPLSGEIEAVAAQIRQGAFLPSGSG